MPQGNPSELFTTARAKFLLFPQNDDTRECLGVTHDLWDEMHFIIYSIFLHLRE